MQGAIDKPTRLGDHKETVDALKELGGNVKFTVVEGLGHDAFRYAYQRPDLYDWFLQHTNPGIEAVERDSEGLEVVTLKSLVAPYSEGPDGDKAVRQFCLDNGLGSESGIRYFAVRSWVPPP